MSEDLIWRLCLLGAVVFTILVFFLRFPDVVRLLASRLRSVQWDDNGVRILLATEQVGEVVAEKEGTAPKLSTLYRDVAGILGHHRILWVDDFPENNLVEIAALRMLGHEVHTARSNADAIAYFKNATVDLVISDIARTSPEQEDAGLLLPTVLRTTERSLPPLIYYVGKAIQGTTDAGFQVTDKPSELFALIRQALGQTHR